MVIVLLVTTLFFYKSEPRFTTIDAGVSLEECQKAAPGFAEQLYSDLKVANPGLQDVQVTCVEQKAAEHA